MRKPVYAICKRLISTFVVRCLDSIIPLLAIAEISRPKLVSSAEQVGLSHNWSQTQKTHFLMMGLMLKRFWCNKISDDVQFTSFCLFENFCFKCQIFIYYFEPKLSHFLKGYILKKNLSLDGVFQNKEFTFVWE